MQEQREFNIWLIAFVVSTLLFIGTGIFALWAYSQYTDQRDNVDQIVAAAVEEANIEQEERLRAGFEEESKSPLTTYNGPAAFGSIVLKYPKTWSAYVEESDGTGQPLDGYFHPGFVNSTRSDALDALRLEVVDRAYDSEVGAFESDLEKGTVTSKAITVAGVTGVRIDGEIEREIVGSLVLLPLRDKTLKLWTESGDFAADFDNIILPNLSFTP